MCIRKNCSKILSTSCLSKRPKQKGQTQIRLKGASKFAILISILWIPSPDFICEQKEKSVWNFIPFTVVDVWSYCQMKENPCSYPEVHMHAVWTRVAFTTADDWDCVVEVELFPALHYCRFYFLVLWNHAFHCGTWKPLEGLWWGLNGQN